jgi:protoheme IX farnesyltransferase
MQPTAHRFDRDSDATWPEPKRNFVVQARDILALSKPRITLMVLMTTAGGAWMAVRSNAGLSMKGWAIAATVVGTALIVAGANALNMYLEREVDKNMERTKDRPLPAGRMNPQVALWFGVVASALAVPILAVFVNSLTALLALVANLSYVLAYTPLKRRSQHALLVGAVPGAIPPLLGYTAATGRIAPAGLVLFGVLFFWQLPHFMAIALFRKGDYARAGLIVTPNVIGDRDTVHAMLRYTIALVVTSLLLVPLHVAHTAYLVVAIVAGVVFLSACVAGFRVDRFRIKSWAKGAFAVSIFYLVLLFATLMIDA